MVCLEFQHLVPQVQVYSQQKAQLTISQTQQATDSLQVYGHLALVTVQLLQQAIVLQQTLLLMENYGTTLLLVKLTL